MSALDHTTKTWIEEKLIPKIKGLLNKYESKVKYNISTPQNSHCVSRLFFLEFNFTNVEENYEKKVSKVFDNKIYYNNFKKKCTLLYIFLYYKNNFV